MSSRPDENDVREIPRARTARRAYSVALVVEENVLRPARQVGEQPSAGKIGIVVLR
jgi:hypothetical protein